MAKKYDLVIFDLDGTLLDTSEGIFNSVRYALKEMHLPQISTELLRKFVGPPPKDMYKKIFELSEEKALWAVKKHREYGKEKAIFEAKVYPEIKNVLAKLKKSNFKLACATLKKQDIAEIVLRNFNLIEYFDVVVGMNECESLSKTDTIRIAMENTKSKTAIMIGDSLYDLEGAKEMSLDFIGVLYGFGFSSFKELDSYNKSKGALRPSDILSFIL